MNYSSNDLFNLMMRLPAQEPDRQVLLYTTPAVKYAMNTEIFLAQFKYCLIHKQTDECYTELKRILTERFGEYQIQILEWRYKQTTLTRMEIF